MLAGKKRFIYTICYTRDVFILYAIQEMSLYYMLYKSFHLVSFYCCPLCCFYCNFQIFNMWVSNLLWGQMWRSLCPQTWFLATSLWSQLKAPSCPVMPCSSVERALWMRACSQVKPTEAKSLNLSIHLTPVSQGISYHGYGYSLIRTYKTSTHTPCLYDRDRERQQNK